jgi:hypothetical protein
MKKHPHPRRYMPLMRHFQTAAAVLTHRLQQRREVLPMFISENLKILLMEG